MVRTAYTLSIITKLVADTIKIPMAKTFARFVRPAETIEHQARGAHKERPIEHLTTLQSVFATTRVIAGRATTPTCRERRERAHSLAKVFVWMRNGIRDYALPWAARCTERLALGIGWRGHCGWRSESIIRGKVEIFDRDCGVSPRDVPPCARGKICLEKSHGSKAAQEDWVHVQSEGRR